MPTNSMPSETVDCQAKRCGFNMLYEISSRHEENHCGFVRCACCDLQAMAARMQRKATGTAGRKWSLRRCLDSMRYSLSNSFDVFCMARGPHVTGSGEGYRMVFASLRSSCSRKLPANSKTAWIACGVLTQEWTVQGGHCGRYAGSLCGP